MRTPNRAGRGSITGIVAATGVLVVVAGTAVALAAEATPAVEPEGGPGGYGEKRLESELSIHVPAVDIETVWQYLVSVYGSRQGWPASLDAAITTRLSDEKFVDRYFDTARLELLTRQHGVRHRIRDIPDAPDDPKDDRQLIQIKATSDGDAVTRREYKYPPRDSVMKGGPGSKSVARLIKKPYRSSFEQAVRDLGADPERLQEVVVLDQHRRRVYFGDAKGPMLTCTLDEVQTRKWWVHVTWAELELEIGEIRYTEASPEERRRLEHFRAVIRGDLLAHFPQLREDNMPKYTEAVAELDRRIPVWRMGLLAREHALPIAGTSSVVIAATAAGITILRRRRRQRRIE